MQKANAGPRPLKMTIERLGKHSKRQGQKSIETIAKRNHCGKVLLHDLFVTGKLALQGGKLRRLLFYLNITISKLKLNAKCLVVTEKKNTLQEQHCKKLGSLVGII